MRTPPIPHEQSERAAPLPRMPALDGVRGVAIVGIILFHGGFAWAKGGFLSVSTFFTLSGFLITNLLVREWERTDTIGLLAFWAKRLRRLMPAALATILLVGLVWWRIGTPEQLGALRGDMVSSLGYVANWHLWATGVSYGSLFSEPTPLHHFWSLAIEEQFYLIFPVLVIVLTRLGGRRLLAICCMAAAVLSVTLMWLMRADFDRIYYGTDTRVAELLFGVLLAIWWSGRSRNTTTPTNTEPLFDLAGAIALGGLVIAWVLVPEASPGLARGGFPLYAALSTVLIYVSTRAGWIARLMSIGILRWAGLISYGLYLYHWPVFALLTPTRTGLSLGPLFVVRVMVTVGIAVLSYFLLEMPVRRRTLLRTSRTAGTAAVAGILGVALCAFVVTLDPPRSTIPYANMRVGELGIRAEPLSPTVAPTSIRPATAWIIGDSAAVDEAPALAAAMQATGSARFIFGVGPGFGLTTKSDWRKDWTKAIEDHRPDFAVIMLGSWDLPFIRENGEAAYERVVDEAITLLTERGVKVLLLPVMPGGKLDVSAVDRAFATVAARHPGTVANPSVMAAFTAPDGSTPRSWTGPDGSVHLLRKTDGWHLCQEGAANLAQRIVDEAVALGWSAPIATAWRSGEWNDAWQYDDPVGTCELSR